MPAQARLKRSAGGERVFKGGDLRGVDWSSQNLRRIGLYGADLTGAKLVNTNLAEADLRYARVEGADLPDANLAGSIRDGWTPEGANRWSVLPWGEEPRRERRRGREEGVLSRTEGGAGRDDVARGGGGQGAQGIPRACAGYPAGQEGVMKEAQEESILAGQEPIWKEEALPEGWEA